MHVYYFWGGSNETAKECYQLGFFAPANADAALAALDMMDFEGIEKVRQRVRQNGTLAQRLEQAQAQLAALLAKPQEPAALPAKSAAPENSSTALARNLPVAAAARAMNV